MHGRVPCVRAGIGGGRLLLAVSIKLVGEEGWERGGRGRNGGWDGREREREEGWESVARGKNEE